VRHPAAGGTPLLGIAVDRGVHGVIPSQAGPRGIRGDVSGPLCLAVLRRDFSWRCSASVISPQAGWR